MNQLQLLQQNSGIKPDGIFGKDTFNASYKYLKITTPQRAVHFFAQISHETAHFDTFIENLMYRSAESLSSVFKHDFDLNKDKIISPQELEFAKKYVGKPEAIANFVYANQNGNGDEKSGDGWKYKGRGALQLTGRANYLLFSQFIKDPEVINNPDLVATKYAFESAMFFFSRFGLWKECDKGLDIPTITKISQMVNGGSKGLQERIQLTLKYAEFIK
jgi:putative chitinase